MSDRILDKAIQRLHQLARHYAIACHVPCSVIDSESVSSSSIPCPLWNTGNQCIGCHEEIVGNFRQSLRFGGSYVFFCAGSLMFWVSPLIIQTKMTYGLIAGPVFVLPLEEIDGDLMEKMGVAGKSVVRKNVSEVTSLAEVLRMVSGWASEYQDTLTASYRNLDLSEKLFEALKEEPRNTYLYYPDVEKELFEAIIDKDLESAQNALDKELWLLSHYHPDDARAMRMRLQEMVMLFSRAALKGHADEMAVWSLCQRTYGSLALQRPLKENISWFRRILGQFVALVDTSSAKDFYLLPTGVQKAIEWVKRSYGDHITLADAAFQAGVSEHYFCRMFKRETGETWGNYLLRFRIGKAKELLLASPASFSDVAESCGFSNQEVFSKAFRRMERESPSEFRKKNLRVYAKP